MTDYATVEELRQLMSFPPGQEQDDVDLQRALDAGKAWVDWFTGRVFGAEGTTASPVAKTIAAATDCTVPLVDLQSTAPVVEVDTAGDRTFATTLVPAQYTLEPYHGPPFDLLRAWPDPAGELSPAYFEAGTLVRVTGVWGYTDARGRIPANVAQANLLLGARWFKRREAPLGVMIQEELDAFQRIGATDPDVSALLFPLSRPGSPGASLAGAAAGGGVYGAAWVAV